MPRWPDADDAEAPVSDARLPGTRSVSVAHAGGSTACAGEAKAVRRSAGQLDPARLWIRLAATTQGVHRGASLLCAVRCADDGCGSCDTSEAGRQRCRQQLAGFVRSLPQVQDGAREEGVMRVFCHVCLRDFVPSDWRSRLCSPECVTIKTFKKPILECKCKNCGRSYKPRAKAYNTYCCRECAFSFKSREAQIRRIEKSAVQKPRAQSCSFCGDSFTSVYRSQKYCSRRCRYMAPCRKKHPATPFICKTCGHPCNKDMRRKSRVFCSLRCGKRFYKSQSKALSRLFLIAGGTLGLRDIPTEILEAAKLLVQLNHEIWKARHVRQLTIKGELI